MNTEAAWGTEAPQWHPGAKGRRPPEAEAIMQKQAHTFYV